MLIGIILLLIVAFIAVLVAAYEVRARRVAEERCLSTLAEARRLAHEEGLTLGYARATTQAEQAYRKGRDDERAAMYAAAKALRQREAGQGRAELN